MTLRAEMAAGRDPFSTAHPATLYECALAVAQGRTRDYSVFRDPFAAEIMDDPEVREWAAKLLPADLLREARSHCVPFGLERGDGPYRCASCGTVSVGMHVAVADRAGWLRDEVTPADLVWCPGCARVALGPLVS